MPWQVAEICQTLVIVSVDYDQGRLQGVSMRSMHLPTSHFKNVVDVYIIILNLFNSGKPYA